VTWQNHSGAREQGANNSIESNKQLLYFTVEKQTELN